MKSATPLNPAVVDDGASPRTSRYERQRIRIVEAAISLVNEKGVRAMTLQEVAQALDLTTTSVTYYYRYKEQLAAAVFEDTLVRLHDMVGEAATAATPRARVARYVEIYFDRFAQGLRGEAAPLAVLSELRTLEDAARLPLLAKYQAIFRDVRLFFGAVDTAERKRLFSARAQMLNEALFWTIIWLPSYPLRDFHNVRRRMMDIFENGIASATSSWTSTIVDPDAGAPDDAKREFLRVAARLINDIGYKGASVERIVGELKITKGSFYHHLDAKDDLILECYRHDYRRMTRIQEEIDASEQNAVSRLVSSTMSALALQFNGLHPLLRTTGLHAMPIGLRQQAVERFERLARWLAGILVDGMGEGSVRIVDPMIAANIIISTINSAYDLRGWARPQPLKDAIDTYTGVLMRGLFD
ncbi:MAG TPA: TetR/AcrR family transcriptional regulator [Sphingomonas sp.]|nr:TetR/AcrR family transcriptional regulator [Sphingomonas sp.]